MDAARFDVLLRFLAVGASRRGLLAGLTSGVLAVLPLALSAENAEAKKRRKRKGKRKKKSCLPEPPTATCAGRCGTWTNNCGQPVACPSCTGGQQCLSNGSCATACVAHSDCPSHCAGCSLPTTEGGSHCLAPVSLCPSQTCTSTAQCPPDTRCTPCVEPTNKRCWPLCAAG